jgi:hypothetical protein
MLLRASISHWWPIVTFCPVNGLPDVLYVTLTFEGTIPELYSVRKRIRRTIAFKKQFMEELAQELSCEFEDAQEVRVTLLTGRHVVVLTKERSK